MSSCATLPSGAEEQSSTRLNDLLQRAFRYALSLTANRASAEDLLQEACLRLSRGSGPWKTGYLQKTVRNLFLDGYRREVERELLPDLRASRQFHDLFHMWPGLYIGVERMTSILWKITCGVLRGEQTYVGVMQNHPMLATIVDFVSDLVRVTPFLQRIAGLREPAPPQRFFIGKARRH